MYGLFFFKSLDFLSTEKKKILLVLRFGDIANKNHLNLDYLYRLSTIDVYIYIIFLIQWSFDANTGQIPNLPGKTQSV